MARSATTNTCCRFVKDVVKPTPHAERFAAEIAAINTAASKKFQAIGKRARKIILPYFSAARLTYVAGNGDWYINALGGERIANDDLPAAIRDLLTIEVAYNDYLGYYIDEIKPVHWKADPPGTLRIKDVGDYRVITLIGEHKVRP